MFLKWNQSTKPRNSGLVKKKTPNSPHELTKVKKMHEPKASSITRHHTNALIQPHSKNVMTVMQNQFSNQTTYPIVISRSRLSAITHIASSPEWKIDIATTGTGPIIFSTSPYPNNKNRIIQKKKLKSSKIYTLQDKLCTLQDTTV